MYPDCVARTIEELEAQLARLRALLREASRARDAAAVSRVRAEMRSVEKAWEEALTVETAKGEAPRGGIESELEAPAPTRRPPRDLASVPVREQVNQALAILGAPASPKLISTAYQAFFADPLVPTKLASLRRDEERSFTAQGHSRPYYICAALTHDRLNPARGLLAVSNWPLERRIVAPLSPRTDFLTHAVGTAEQIQRLAAAGHSPRLRLGACFAASPSIFLEPMSWASRIPSGLSLLLAARRPCIRKQMTANVSRRQLELVLNSVMCSSCSAYRPCTSCAAPAPPDVPPRHIRQQCRETPRQTMPVQYPDGPGDRLARLRGPLPPSRTTHVRSRP